MLNVFENIIDTLECEYPKGDFRIEGHRKNLEELTKQFAYINSDLEDIYNEHGMELSVENCDKLYRIIKTINEFPRLKNAWEESCSKK